MTPDEIKKGGYAFPTAIQAAGGTGIVLGMTLRDYFAAKTLADSGEMGTPEQVAKWAYKVADAMLAERSKA